MSVRNYLGQNLLFHFGDCDFSVVIVSEVYLDYLLWSQNIFGCLLKILKKNLKILMTIVAQSAMFE